MRQVKPREKSTVEDLKIEDEWIQDNQDKATMLAGIFFPKLPAAILPMHEEIDVTWDTTRPPGNVEGPIITMNEIRRTCTRMRSKAATGMDELSIIILQRCSRELFPFLHRVFNASLSLGFFPSRWREARVLALRKPGKPSYHKARAYRPISLLNHFLVTKEFL